MDHLVKFEDLKPGLQFWKVYALGRSSFIELHLVTAVPELDETCYKDRSVWWVETRAQPVGWPLDKKPGKRSLRDMNVVTDDYSGYNEHRAFKTLPAAEEYLAEVISKEIK